MLRVEVNLGDVKVAIDRFRSDPTGALDELVHGWRQQFAGALTTIMDAEIELFLGSGRVAKDNSRNGYVTRSFTVKGVGQLDVRVPRDRRGKFQSSVLPPRRRYDLRIQEDLALMHLCGMSTRTLALMSERFFGRQLSPQEVSEATASLQEGVQRWRSRPLGSAYRYLFIDGTNFNVRRGDVGREPVLVAIGVDQEGCRAVLGIQSGDKESAKTWDEFFGDLLRRGLDAQAVRLGILDGLPGLEETFAKRFPKAKVQRCQVHKARNVLAKVPRRFQDEVHKAMTLVFYNETEASSREAFASFKAQFGRRCPDAVACLERDLDAILAFYNFPKVEWPSLRSTNPIERLNKEFKRRTKSMEVVGGEQTVYTILAYVSMRMEHTWKKAKLGKNNVVHLKPFEVRATQNT